MKLSEVVFLGCIRLIRGLMDHFDKGVPAPLVQHGHSGIRRTKKSLKNPCAVALFICAPVRMVFPLIFYREKWAQRYMSRRI